MAITLRLMKSGPIAPAEPIPRWGPGRSAIEAHSDPHRELKRKFAQQLADVLAHSLEKRSFAPLIIVAPPTALGDLRAAMPPPLVPRSAARSQRILPRRPTANWRITSRRYCLVYSGLPA